MTLGMRCSRLAPLCVVLSLALPGPAWASEALQRLNDFYREVQSMQADFHQRQQAGAAQPVQDSEGRMLIQRPGKFRWDYRAPYEQHIVADGAKLWIYDVDLEQVTVKALGSALGDTPALLLSGGRPLEEQFLMIDAGQHDGLHWVELQPQRSDASFESVRLGFGPETLRAMELVDGLGQRTELRFENVRYNTKLDSAAFEFTPPPGVDVIGETD